MEYKLVANSIPQKIPMKFLNSTGNSYENRKKRDKRAKIGEYALIRANLLPLDK
jgi:hypothetical protein